MSSFIVQITPLILPDPGVIDEADILTATQFEDVDVAHAINSFRTAGVVLSMHDEVVEFLEPFEFALRILYEDRQEPVFWGPANITDDFTNGKCIIDAYDPSIRLMHHYLRRGDAALNGVPFVDQGTIWADTSGIALCVDAARNIPEQDARNDPELGLYVYESGGWSADLVEAPVIVERGQECWQVITDIARHAIAPDFDMKTCWDLNYYTEITTHATAELVAEDEWETRPGLGVDRTEEVEFAYVPNGNLTGFSRRGSRPTTHAHALSRDARFRQSAGAIAASNKTGVYVDWIGTDLGASEDLQQQLKALANARVGAYGVAPRFIEVVAHPDKVIDHNYGHAEFEAPVGTRPATYYIGDRISAHATRGYRSHDGAARVVGAHLTQKGPREPAITALSLVPTVGGIPLDEEQ